MNSNAISERYQMFLMALESFEELVTIISDVRRIYPCVKRQLMDLLKGFAFGKKQLCIKLIVF